MRAFDICMLLICIQLSLTFVGSIGLFDQVFYTNNQEASSSTGFMTGSLNDTARLLGSQTYTTIDYFSMGVSLLVSSFGILISMLGSVIIFLPQLIWTFHIPLPLALVIQTLIYCTYAWAYVQFLSGRSGAIIQ